MGAARISFLNQFAGKQKPAIHREAKHDCLFRITRPIFRHTSIVEPWKHRALLRLCPGLTSRHQEKAPTTRQAANPTSPSDRRMFHPPECIRPGFRGRRIAGRDRPDKPSGLGGGRCHAPQMGGRRIFRLAGPFRRPDRGSWVGSWETPTRTVHRIYVRPPETVPNFFAPQEKPATSGFRPARSGPLRHGRCDK